MLLFLFSFTSFYLIRLCLHWFLPFQYTHSISLWPLFVSFTRSPLDFSLRALSHPVDPSTDDTAVTSKCLFLFRFSFFFYSYFPLAPHILTPCLVFGRNAFRCLFLYLMICSKSAYYPDPLSADEQRREREKNCTHVPNGTSCSHVCTENCFFQPFFVICHSRTQK